MIGRIFLAVVIASGLTIFTAASAGATSIAPLSTGEAVGNADVVAHVTVESISTLSVADGACGIVYRAKVHEVLKGKRQVKVEFFAPFGDEHLSIGLDTIVFLGDIRTVPENNVIYSGISEPTKAQSSRARRCVRAAGKYVLSNAMPYTIARSDPFDDSIHNYEDETEIRRWYDEHLMARLPSGITPNGIANVRNVGVDTYLVDGKPTKSTDENIRRVVPLELRENVTLAPVSQIKDAIRRAVRESDF